MSDKNFRDILLKEIENKKLKLHSAYRDDEKILDKDITAAAAEDCNDRAEVMQSDETITSSTKSIYSDLAKCIDEESQALQKSISFGELKSVAPELIRSDRAQLILQVNTFYKVVLEEWREYIDDHEEELKKSHEGRLTVIAKAQSKDIMRPLFKRLSKDQLDHDLLQALAQIASYLQQREYVKANDSYLQMAIGKAPWPIGVTAVGIHERSSRERIKSSHVAHVLNDETTRKWVQMVKRLITHCQRIRAPTDSSKAMG